MRWSVSSTISTLLRVGTDSTTTLTPPVNQVFFVGDGTLGNFLVPSGATELNLGTTDCGGLYNNLGSFSVTATVNAAPGPTPARACLASLYSFWGALTPGCGASCRFNCLP
jgi:hypothetical protein